MEIRHIWGIFNADYGYIIIFIHEHPIFRIYPITIFEVIYYQINDRINEFVVILYRMIILLHFIKT